MGFYKQKKETQMERKIVQSFIGIQVSINCRVPSWGVLIVRILPFCGLYYGSPFV